MQSVKNNITYVCVQTASGGIIRAIMCGFVLQLAGVLCTHTRENAAATFGSNLHTNASSHTSDLAVVVAAAAAATIAE